MDRMQKLANGVYAESDFQGVTVGAVVTEQGIVCVDTPTHPADARRWRLKLAQLSQKPIQYVVNLDHHRDRVIGNQWFEAPVIAHEAASERIRAYPEQFRVALSESGADADLAGELAGVKLVPPQLTFTQELILHKGGRELFVEHRGGAAPGASWVHLPDAKVLFVGDLLTLGAPPFLAEADIDRWLELLGDLRRARYRGYTFVPGRGPATDQSALKGFASYLSTVVRKVRRFHASDRPKTDLDQLVPSLLTAFNASNGLRDLYARRIRFGLEHLYDQVGSKKQAEGRERQPR